MTTSLGKIFVELRNKHQGIVAKTDQQEKNDQFMGYMSERLTEKRAHNQQTKIIDAAVSVVSQQ